ncbi:MAG TPA: SDR family NAD(P)-dependent oxidoreductase [Nocardioides sp.]|nr:SDR family NAD(P)-dependent oxidoreductase [Nocardioides sp.]
MNVPDVDRYGPYAVILGGSEGVGASFARQLAEAGFGLVLVARKPDALEATAEQVRALGADVRTLSLDLTTPDSVTALIEATADLEVGLLICNAGANSYGHRFLDGELDGFAGVIDLNITTPLALAHHYGRTMRERGRGGIVFVGSLAGYLGAAREGVYGAAKAFGRIFAEALWLELREYDVHVLELVLGVTRTPAMERAGLNFDLPGLNVGEPDDIAREGLAHLADGPVRIAGGNEQVAELRSGPDRARLVLRSHEAMQRLLPQEH